MTTQPSSNKHYLRPLPRADLRSEVSLLRLPVASRLDLSSQYSSKVKLNPLKPLSMWSKDIHYYLQRRDSNRL